MNAMPPQRVPLSGALDDYEVKPFKPSSFTPDGWFCVYMKGAGNLYEGPGPVRVFSA